MESSQEKEEREKSHGVRDIRRMELTAKKKTFSPKAIETLSLSLGSFCPSPTLSCHGSGVHTLPCRLSPSRHDSLIFH